MKLYRVVSKFFDDGRVAKYMKDIDCPVKPENVEFEGKNYTKYIDYYEDREAAEEYLDEEV